ncbi:MAG: hypothetical protein RQ899_10350 [Pseudomonadales bacterium]|nr:hypothetical protein [Pseudomonadales bacterium]
MKTISRHLILPALASCLVLVACTAQAQAPAPPAPAPASAREAAPHDLTGYWVALVTEDWRFRMVPAPVGDHPGVPLSPAGLEKADTWNPEQDIAAGEECRAYGAGGIMRIPTRLHVSWQNDNVLSIETDAGRQTRLLQFGPAQDHAGSGTWQGVSHARWNLQRAGGFGSPVVNGTLAVMTREMRPGYFRRNGAPYSEQATLTEYIELLKHDNDQDYDYLMVTSILEDPVYLTSRVITSTHFKREADASKWDPAPCLAR